MPHLIPPPCPELLVYGVAGCPFPGHLITFANAICSLETYFKGCVAFLRVMYHTLGNHYKKSQTNPVPIS